MKDWIHRSILAIAVGLISTGATAWYHSLSVPEISPPAKNLIKSLTTNKSWSRKVDGKEVYLGNNPEMIRVYPGTFTAIIYTRNEQERNTLFHNGSFNMLDSYKINQAAKQTIRGLETADLNTIQQ